MPAWPDRADRQDRAHPAQLDTRALSRAGLAPKGPPLTARNDQIQDGVDYLPHVQRPGPTSRLGSRHEIFDILPLAVGQVRGIVGVAHTPKCT